MAIWQCLLADSTSVICLSVYPISRIGAFGAAPSDGLTTDTFTFVSWAVAIEEVRTPKELPCPPHSTLDSARTPKRR
jgi:hypothetical protein